MVTRIRENEPVTPTEQDAAAVKQLGELLESGALDNAQLVTANGQKMDVPEPIAKALRQIIPPLARGEAITVVPHQENQELSTFEAANLLHVSRPHLIKLLEEGAIPYRMTGTHRRIYLQDVLAYDKWRHKESKKILDDMLALAQEARAYN